MKLNNSAVDIRFKDWKKCIYCDAKSPPYPYMGKDCIDKKVCTDDMLIPLKNNSYICVRCAKERIFNGT